jgi:mRNA-processing protein COX24
MPCAAARFGGRVPIRPHATNRQRGTSMGSVIKKRRKRMSKKKHRKLLRKTRVQRRKLKK